MPARIRYTPQARLRRIVDRQSTPRWGTDYVPGTLATPQEAPRICRPSILRPAKLNRDTHLLSEPETSAALLALYSPLVWDLHEQHMLSPEPAAHPLQGHPLALGMQLPRVEGTVPVAAAMGQLGMHARIYVEEFGDWVPDVYEGDLLLFCLDEIGPYCINWTVKKDEAGFRHAGIRLHGRSFRTAPDKKAEFRHELEERYFLDASIRTQRIYGDAIDRTFAHNLAALFLHHARQLLIGEETRAAILQELEASVGGKTAAFATCRRLAQRFSLSAGDVRTVLLQAIWHRQIRVDLFWPLLVDKPLRREERDPLVVYAAWFAR